MQEKTIGPDESWRMVYSDGKVMMLEKLTGYTTTIHDIFEASTKEECEAEVLRLGLMMQSPEPVPEAEQSDDLLASLTNEQKQALLAFLTKP